MKISQETIDAVKRVQIVDLAYRLGDNPKRVGSSYQVPCPNPNHYERTPDTYIQPTHNFYTCFGGGGCGAKGDVISYYSWHTFGGYEPKLHFVDAVKGIAELMGIPVQYENTSTTSYSRTSHSMPLKFRSNPFSTVKQDEVVSADDATCDLVYRKFLNLCPIEPDHAKEWLGPKRQYTQEQILKIGLRSVPKGERLFKIINQLLKEGIKLNGIPGFTQKVKRGGDPNFKDWYWTINAHKGYFIPVRNDKGQIVRLRVATGGKPKYIWFSSNPTVFKKDGEWRFFDNTLEQNKENHIHEMSKGGAPSGAPINVVVPFDVLRIWEPGTDLSDIYEIDEVVITEGEHKSNISANRLRKLVVGVPGVGAWRKTIPLLKKWGAKKIVLAYDMDSLKAEEKVEGKNQQVYEQLVAFAKELRSEGFRVVLWTWNVKDGKGLDDLLLNKKLPIEIDLVTGKKSVPKVA